jgi:hypothetical protein
MTYKYKGRGLIQITGKQNMSQSGVYINPITTISGSQYNWNSLGNITMNSAGVNDLFDLSISQDHYKKYEIYEFQDDILAISCAWKRQRDSNPGDFTYGKLTEKKLFDSVINSDRELASNIRDYYSKKIMMLTLKGQSLTSFRKDLNSFVHGDTNRATDELLPLIYKLPEFYEYDNKIEEIKLSLEDRLTAAKLEKLHGKQTIFELAPITKVKKHNKKINVMEYWFSRGTNTAVLIQLEPKNPLLHLWDEIFDSKKVLQISGLPFVKNMDDFEYLSIKNFKLQKG